jgi:hypothetical protein
MNLENLQTEWAAIQAQFQTTHKLGLDTRDEPKRAIFEAAIYWLAKIYLRADWRKIARNPNVHRENVFEHVIKAAGAQSNIRRVNDRMCEDLGLQSVEIPTAVFDFLECNKRVTLQSLRKEPVYFSLKAMELADQLIKQRIAAAAAPDPSTKQPTVLSLQEEKTVEHPPIHPTPAISL